MRIRNVTKMGEGLQCCRSSPGEDLQWKGGDLQCCKPSPCREGLQCCRSSGGRSVMLKIFLGEGLQCCKPSGGSARGKVCNTTPVRNRFFKSEVFSWRLCVVSCESDVLLFPLYIIFRHRSNAIICDIILNYSIDITTY